MRYGFLTPLLLAACLVGLTSSGCASRGGICGADCCADIPSGAIPEPVGTKLCQWQTDQIHVAAADRNVFYQADFVGRSDELSPGAYSRLSQLTASGSLDSSIVVEPTGDASLDQARVATVITTLSTAGIKQPDVRVAIPAALGLSGPQAEQIAGGLGRNRGGAGNNAARSGLGSVISGSVFP